MAHEKERELITQFILKACEDQKTITPAYIDDFLSTLPEEKETGWINIEDMLPPEKQDILCYNGYRRFVKSWQKFTGNNEIWLRENVIYWRYLPDIP
jgi:hypothetical protein